MCVAFSALMSIIIVVCKNEKQIFGDINRGVTIRYDDIIKIAFDDTLFEEKIVVVPVNRCFDLSCDNNLINPIPIHGQWINRYIVSEEQRDILNKKISFMLKDDYKMISINEKMW